MRSLIFLGAKDMRNKFILASMIIVSVLTGFTQAAIYTFQEGNGYSGTSDTFLRESYPDTPPPPERYNRIEVDGGVYLDHGLIKFDNIFGNEPDQVPLSATITSATLKLRVPQSDWTSTTWVAVHRMLQPWSEGSSTWNSMVNGISPDGIEAEVANVIVGPPLSVGWYFIDVTDSVVAWQGGAANHGWAILPNIASLDGVLFASSEYSEEAYHPILEIVPEPALGVTVDIKPGSCPNPLDVKSSGVLPVAILGSAGFDVTTIDATSVQLAGVSAIRHSFEDVATPVSDSNDCNCITDDPDGFLDLTLKFKSQRIVDVIGEVEHGDVLTLDLDGVLFGERPIVGTDCIVIRGRHKPFNEADVNKDGVVNMTDFALMTENWLQSSIVQD